MKPTTEQAAPTRPRIASVRFTPPGGLLIIEGIVVSEVKCKCKFEKPLFRFRKRLYAFAGTPPCHLHEFAFIMKYWIAYQRIYDVQSLFLAEYGAKPLAIMMVVHLIQDKRTIRHSHSLRFDKNVMNVKSIIMILFTPLWHRKVATLSCTRSPASKLFLYKFPLLGKNSYFQKKKLLLGAALGPASGSSLSSTFLLLSSGV